MSCTPRTLWPTQLGVSILLVSGLACGDDGGADAVDAAPVVTFDAAATPDAVPTIDAMVQQQFMPISASRVGDLYRIDKATGVPTLVLNTTTVVGKGEIVDVGVVSSLEWVASKSELWAGTGGNAAVTAAIQTVNPSTGALTTFVDLGNDQSIGGIPSLSLHPTDGLMYMADGDTSGIQTVTTADGTYNDINGAAGGQGNGMAIASDGTMYIADRANFQVADPADGSIISMTTITYSGFPAFEKANQPIVAMAFDPSDGVLYGLVQDGAINDDRAVCYFVSIDPATAIVTHIGPTTSQEMDGLAFVPTDFFPAD